MQYKLLALVLFLLLMYWIYRGMDIPPDDHDSSRWTDGGGY